MNILVINGPNINMLGKREPGHYGQISFYELEDLIREQADKYGHSPKREMAFLIAHSMFHLCGYDHMTEEEARVMEQKQENALRAIGITRDN